MFEYNEFILTLFLIPILAVLYVFRLKDRNKTWEVFHNKTRWKNTISGYSSNLFFWRKAIILFDSCTGHSFPS